ncbi:TIGR00282 family metallophosphoesterase [Ruminococcus difficilis]|uniref:TIGR00282 family metallophosphoesterase n=1 Tax=Ruminococcus difficilis TaxID=2763069 RepID=A0A934WUQ7_9FIRM|nr:TIGR00282 family metallophosphoesterase [Ruminococcus difficilis]MBK6090353.1 TIGR00282 family metallophosphoesterase [Ruminococcus difficilis]
MRIMCIGDVVGSVGCEFLRQRLPRFKQQQQIDFVICNGENSADGNGITPRSAEHLFTSGVDFITLGNHSFRRKEVYPYLDEHPHIIRPANYPTSSTPGCGWAVVDMGFTSIGVINLMGQQFMDANLDNPFIRADQILKELDAKIILVDFHAEATSEKRAMGFYLDGRVSAVFGTHTHVLTGDAQVLPEGTGYITDVGMTGVIDSILGVKKEIILRRFTTQLPERFDLARGDCKLNCAVFDIDRNSGKCTAAQSYELI